MNEGWTHIRIEFVDKTHNENILQSSLITTEPDEILFTTLKPTADALVDIVKQHRDLNDATEAIADFQPIEEKAQEIIDADRGRPRLF